MIHLARHGETPDNVPPMRLMGHRDTALSDQGRREADALAEAAVRVGARSLYTSPLVRAHDTARAVGEALGLEPIVDERLMESRRGTWEGRLMKDIEREDAALWAAWQRPTPSFRFPGGESLEEHVRRVRAAVEELAAVPQPTLAVCHGGTIRCALLDLWGLGTESFHELRVPHAVLIPLDPKGSVAAGAALRGGGPAAGGAPTPSA